jgi:hypothetical protein
MFSGVRSNNIQRSKWTGNRLRESFGVVNAALWAGALTPA